MNDIAMNDKIDSIVSIISQIKTSSSDNEGLIKINSFIPEFKDKINDLFSDFGYNCRDIFYTLNTDKEYFGVMINPIIDGVSAFKIFATSEDVSLTDYQLELDSKLIDSQLTSKQILSVIIFEITSIMNPGQIAHVRSLIDLHVLSEDDVLQLRDSINYTQLIIYALKDTLYKVSSMLYKSDVNEVLSQEAIQTLNLEDDLISAYDKLLNDVYGINDSLRSPKTVILQWVFMIYKDIKGYYVHAKDTLRTAKEFTASKLINMEIDKTISAIDRANGTIVKENVSLNSLLESNAMYSINELGLFKSLKLSGLKTIEDEYYELAVQAKSIDTENDALYVIRCINSRLSILEDYIYNNNLRESDKKHWMQVAKMYRALRNEVLNKKINKRKYQDIFMDFDEAD